MIERGTSRPEEGGADRARPSGEAPARRRGGTPAPKAPVRVLLVEDSEDDADLTLCGLRRGGLALEYERVDTVDGLREALARGAWDVVLSDYGMPRFNALEAFAVVQAGAHDLPFIIVSGTMGEDTAVEAMRVGVHDYIVKGHRARLVLSYADVPRVEANAARLGQVFLNLLINAAQAIDEGRADRNEIRVSTSLDAAGRVVTEVRDTGHGMPPEVMARVFDPFFTTKPVGVGTGLGLSICDRIVCSFGGEIEVSSVPGEGTVFRVLLPRAVTRPAAAHPPSALPAPMHHGRVLVVDDEPAIGVAIRRALRHAYDVRVATRAAEALRWVTAGERFDVVFCDLMMPERTGMDFYEDLRDVAPELLERVVFVTGGTFTDRTRAFLDALPNPRLDKPFDVRDLRVAILGRLR